MNWFHLILSALLLSLSLVSTTLAQYEIGSLDAANGSGSGSSDDISSKAEDSARKEEAGTAPNRDTIDYQSNLLQTINEPALSRALSDESGSNSGGGE